MSLSPYEKRQLNVMTRAKNSHSSSFIWHLTNRCHNREFLLKFKSDRRNFLLWLYKAKQKYGLIILNYMITSNHIHLLVYDDGRHDVVSRSILLAAGRTAYEYNRRKNRSGAFWGDSYHATAVGSGNHFLECLLYIDLNMVRAGVVKHPRNWPMCGYNEIMGAARKRYRLIDKSMLMQLLAIHEPSELRKRYDTWIQERLAAGQLKREKKWTESVAVGNKDFVEMFQKEKGRKLRQEIHENDDGSFLLK